MSERMNCMAKKEAFITLEDHKVNFANALPCRVINPAKPAMGEISKATLDRIISAVQQQLPLNMLKSTGAVSDWFTRLKRSWKALSSALISWRFILRSPRTSCIEPWTSPAVSLRSHRRTRTSSWTRRSQCYSAKGQNGSNRVLGCLTLRWDVTMETKYMGLSACSHFHVWRRNSLLLTASATTGMTDWEFCESHQAVKLLGSGRILLP